MPVCPACKNEIEAGADPCPYCGAELDWGQPQPPAEEPAPPVAEESPVPDTESKGQTEEPAGKPESKPGRQPWLVALLPALLVFMCMCMCCVGVSGYRLLGFSESDSFLSGLTGEEESANNDDAGSKSEPPDYEMVTSAEIDGVAVQDVVVSSEDVTRNKLDALARRLAQDTPEEQSLLVRIYDDQEVVELASQADLPPEQQEKLFSHWRATYTRNLSEGINKLEIWKSDHQETTSVVDYTQQ